jgi:hypothetical protein
VPGQAAGVRRRLAEPQHVGVARLHPLRRGAGPVADAGAEIFRAMVRTWRHPTICGNPTVKFLNSVASPCLGRIVWSKDGI